jgi:hypothetical protein
MDSSGAASAVPRGFGCTTRRLWPVMSVVRAIGLGRSRVVISTERELHRLP